jgi:hydroxyethylthiazole kinase-like uncharacterized protein yjeF
MPLPEPAKSISLYTSAELREFESHAQKGLPAGTLMDRAGRAVALWSTHRAAEIAGPVVVLAGPGNNGGDALTAAAELKTLGIEVEVALLVPAESFKGDALRAWLRWQALGGGVKTSPGFDSASIILDGLFGIGLNKPVPEPAADWITRLNAWQARTARPVLAIDIPSGLTADTGQVLGTAVRATHTLTFLGAKPGLFTGDGPDYAGEVSVDALGTVGDAPVGFLSGPERFSVELRARPKNSNKGQFGNLGVLAGAEGMVGAGFLAARMGLLGGAGRVYLNLPGADAPPVDPIHPELMLRRSFEGLKLSAAIVGPGLGEPLAEPDTFRALLSNPIPLVVDADALNAVSADPSLAEALRTREGPSIVTPHPLEAARLLGTDVATVQLDRIGAAKRIAQKLDAYVVLKGAGSVLAAPNGNWAINPTGNPGLASAGTGDVLSGLLGALLAQGWSAWHALLGGVWLHGRAADRLVAEGTGPIGLAASELIAAIRSELNSVARPAPGGGRAKHGS